MADEAAEFWRQFEAETGEKVELRCLGQWFESEEDDRGFWGLMILTDRSFRFKHMPSDNWLLSLFKSAGRAPAKSKAFDIVIPRGDILFVEQPKRGFLARVFGQAYETVRVRWRSPEGETGGRFALEPRSEFLAALSKCVVKS